MVGILALIRFESPGYLVLLAALPFIVVLAFRSMAGLDPVRRIAAILLRCAVWTALTLALAGAERVRTNEDLTVVYLLDRSASIPPAQQQAAMDFIRAAADEKRATEDRFAIVAFDGASVIEQTPSGGMAVNQLSPPVNPDQTNLAAALRLGLALLPADTMRRVVLLSDGNQNVGDALEEAGHYRAVKIPVDVVPIRYQHGAEVAIERLSSPPTANREESVNLQLILRSTQPTTGRVRLYQNEELVDLDPDDPQSSAMPVELAAGPNRITLTVPLRETGAHRFQATFEPDDPRVDTITANNEGRAFTIVSGQGRILVLTTPENTESAEKLRVALEREKIDVIVQLAGAVPIDQVRLLEYSAVILSNVPANFFSEEEQEILATYVRDLGGGLVMIGGDESFGAGGWLGSPVEEVMPVTFDVKNKRQIPKGGLILVMHACEIPQGNYIGTRSAVAAVKSLSSRDWVGVLSYQWQGGQQGYWVVPFQEVGTKTPIIRKVLKMQMGDMPDFEPVIRPGIDALAARPDIAAKHMIVISDFDPMPPSEASMQKMIASNISCSTIAVGFGGHPINTQLATGMATQTGGKYYPVRDFSEVPQIFIKESRIVRRSLLFESPFEPQIIDPIDQFITGFNRFPQFRGHVLATPKPLASVPLVRPTEDGFDPILAYWPVGLGKTVAFTTGMWHRWGDLFVQDPRFGPFWAQLIRWASRDAASAAFDISTSVQGGRGRIRVNALDANAAAINFMNIEGTLVAPSGESQPLRLTQVGPGAYEGDFDAQEAGSYIVNLQYQTGGQDGRSGSFRTGVAVAYSPEYRDLATNDPLLAGLLDRTAGRALAPTDADQVFDLAGLPPAESRRPIWEDLVRWMLLLFLLDVAVRRVALNPVQMARRVRNFLAEMGGKPPADESAAVLTGLKGARERLREAQDTDRPEAGRPPDKAAKYEAPDSPERSTRELTDALDGASELNKPVVAQPPRKPAATDEAGYTSRLLQAKRRAQRKPDADEDQKNE